MIKNSITFACIVAIGGSGLLSNQANAIDDILYRVTPANTSNFQHGRDWILRDVTSRHWYRDRRTGYNVLDVSSRADCSSPGGCGFQTLSIGRSTCESFSLDVSFGGSITGVKHPLSPGLTASVGASKSWTVCNNRSESRSCPAQENKSVYAFIGVDRWLGNFGYSSNETILPGGAFYTANGYSSVEPGTGGAHLCDDRGGTTGYSLLNWTPHLCRNQKRESSYRVISENFPRDRFTDCRVRNRGQGFGSRDVTE